MRLTLAVLLAATGPAAAAPPVDYNRDVKPILANSCFTCHGPDEGQRQVDLRLDVRDAAKFVLRPGNPAKSKVLARVTSPDADDVMPPPSSKKPRLTPEQVATLKRWIEEGAKYDEHWAFVPPKRPAVPAVRNPAWVRNPIDAFVAAGHARQGFTPAPEADRVTLARRLAFDLTGLPPAPAEAEAFAADRSPDAYEKYVDRLLASPAYGERMAAEWLDAVRYADTGGYHSDNHRDVWPYRDYVIAAFTANKPFDRFTVEQLAGDLLPNPTREQRIASGYNRLLQTTEEGGAQAKEYAAKYAADRVRNAASVWLGATLGCAECHNHKYDPYTTRDFYRFAAFFADVQERAVGRQDQTPVPTAEQSAALARLDGDLNGLRAKAAARTPEWDAAQAEWERLAREQLVKSAPVWSPVRPAKAESKGGATLAVGDDLSVLASGDRPDKDVYTVVVPAEGAKVTALRLEALTHATLGGKPGRGNGNFVLTGFEVKAGDKPVKVASASADYEQDGFPVAHAIDAKPQTGWAVDGQSKPADRAAVFRLAEPVAGGPGVTLTVVLKFHSQFPAHAIGRFRLSVTATENAGVAEAGLPAAVVRALAVDAAERSAEQREALSAHWRSVAPELRPLREAVAKVEAARKRLTDEFPKTLVAMAGPPRPVRVLPRGNWLDDSGEAVTPDVPAFLGTVAPAEKRATRLDLAHWLVAPDHPLTARVYVNRLWKLAFGVGLVKTPDDFGTQGALPTHPELLDWLAVEFRETGWDVKRLVRLIVTSNAYRMSSVPGKPEREKDPANQWLARQNRWRLDAEAVRDNALTVSGLLVRRVGGPSVKPYQPGGYWVYLNFPKRDWDASKGADQYRRGLYTYWCRSFLHPSLLAFDAPTREECCVDRPRSSTPLQALVLLNDPTYVEAARALAERAVGVPPEARADALVRAVLSRPAKSEEVRLLTQLADKHREEYRRDPEAAKKLLAVGEKPAAEADAAELAAWASAARVVLNLHEAVTRN